MSSDMWLVRLLLNYLLFAHNFKILGGENGAFSPHFAHGNYNKLSSRAKVIFFLLLILDTPKKRLKGGGEEEEAAFRWKEAYDDDDGRLSALNFSLRSTTLLYYGRPTERAAIRASLLYVPLNQAYYAENRMNEGLSLYQPQWNNSFVPKELIYWCGKNSDIKRDPSKRNESLKSIFLSSVT